MVTNLKKSSYEKLQVLNDVSFSVKEGESLGIIGINGSGKTTILKLISKIYYPDHGTIHTNGKLVPLLQLGIGFHPELTATDNIITYGILLGLNKNTIKSKIDKILEYAELEKFADVKIKHFSSGMFSRIAFATAINIEPDILLVDEVLAVGDIFFQKKGFETFDKLKKKGKTIILVSHDPAQILRICDRVMVLKNGKIEKIGDPQEIVNYYLQSGKFLNEK